MGTSGEPAYITYFKGAESKKTGTQAKLLVFDLLMCISKWPSHFVQLFLGDPKAFPGPPRDSLSSVSWVFPGVSYQWDVP